ncbi:hypothetical protein [Armatimonas sp.]|uniref:hypothetical protein n=1 Tax=Armatimonas sp. TaxID=1872638 RepID=UPI0037522337
MTQRTGQLLDHTGQLLEDDREFSEPAPPTIGRVQSAFSTLRHGETPSFSKKSIARATIYGALVVVLLGTLIYFSPQFGKDTGIVWGAGGFFSLILLVMGIVALRPHEYSYTGEKGIARFYFSGSGLANLLAREMKGTTRSTGVFLFEQARVLYNGSIRHYTNGIYTGTDTRFTWMDGDGKPLYTLASHYYSYKENPGPEASIHFFRAAEKVWTAWVMEKHREELERQGKTGFPLRTGGAIFLTRHGITVREGKNETEFLGDSLKGVTLQQGQLCLHRDGEKAGLFGKGPYTIAYEQIGNVQALFTLASETLKF